MAKSKGQTKLCQTEGPDGPIFYELTRKAVKNLNLRVRADGSVAVSAPPRVSATQVQRFVSQRGDWIAQARRRIEARSPAAADRAALLGRGVPFALNPEGAPGVEARQGKLLLSLAEGQGPEDALEAFRRQAAAPVMARAMELARSRFERAGIDLPPLRKLTLRAMKSRWGSCVPAKGRITLNLTLMKKPFPCIEYVAVHELCHLLAAGHGPDFYRLLEQAMPDWRKWKQLLGQPDPGL